MHCVCRFVVRGTSCDCNDFAYGFLKRRVCDGDGVVHVTECFAGASFFDDLIYGMGHCGVIIDQKRDVHFPYVHPASKILTSCSSDATYNSIQGYVCRSFALSFALLGWLASFANGKDQEDGKGR